MNDACNVNVTVTSDHSRKIEELVKSHPIYVFMKGTPEEPACRFSAMVKDIFGAMKVPFQGYNILEDYEMRQAIKDYTNWPTLPQIFIKGNFIGGADILLELQESGELEKMLAEFRA